MNHVLQVGGTIGCTIGLGRGCHVRRHLGGEVDARQGIGAQGDGAALDPPVREADQRAGPLIPAMHPSRGDRRALLEEVLERISGAPLSLRVRQDLMSWVTTFATLHLQRETVSRIVETVSRRHRHMLDPLRDFPMLRETFEEGKREGKREGKKEERAQVARMLQDRVLELARQRFGAGALPEADVRDLDDPEALALLLVRLGTKKTLKDALSS